MDPGAVLSDIDHFEKVGINTCLLARGPKDGLVRAGRTGSNHNAIQVMLFDGVLNSGCARFRTRKQIGLDCNNIGQRSGIFTQIFNIQNPSDIDTAMTNKDSYSKFSLHFVSPCVLGYEILS
jgi:hypothetical protein